MEMLAALPLPAVPCRRGAAHPAARAGLPGAAPLPPAVRRGAAAAGGAHGKSATALAQPWGCGWAGRGVFCRKVSANRVFLLVVGANNNAPCSLSRSCRPARAAWRRALLRATCGGSGRQRASRPPGGATRCALGRVWGACMDCCCMQRIACLTSCLSSLGSGHLPAQQMLFFLQDLSRPHASLQYSLASSPPRKQSQCRPY